jgi:phage/plasmid-like protein (TIGR03299 family)
VANILGDDLAISSAGLLRGGAIAWVEVSVPESITTPEGVTFRPNLLATMSFDGSIATTFKRTVTHTVRDNTRESALAEHGQTYRVKHSRHSHAQLAPPDKHWRWCTSIADGFAAEVATLCAIDVFRGQWAQFLDRHVPREDPTTGKPLEGRALTTADTKRAVLQRLYHHDSRVSPWAGTAHGILQAVNTYEHHEGTVRGASRADRNMLRTVTEDLGKIDRAAWKELRRLSRSRNDRWGGTALRPQSLSTSRCQGRRRASACPRPVPVVTALVQSRSGERQSVSAVLWAVATPERRCRWGWVRCALAAVGVGKGASGRRGPGVSRASRVIGTRRVPH